MAKTQSILGLIKNDFSFFILILITIISLFLVLSPKTGSQLLPFRRQTTLNEFISSTKHNGFINPQEYWKFREFYSPGYFTFSGDALESLVFSSPLVNSLDVLTDQTNLNAIFQKQLPKKSIIFMDKNSLIYQETPTIIKIVFLLSNNDLKKTNGFFDYNDKDKKPTENKNWYNTTTVRILK